MVRALPSHGRGPGFESRIAHHLRHYRGRVRRLCEKPGCGAPAEASYGIDQVHLVVWIDALEVAERESAGRLCRRHADSLEGPRGWTTDDRRQPVPMLFRSHDKGDDTTGARRSKPARRTRAAQVDTPSLFESIRRDLESAGGASTPGGGTGTPAPHATVEERADANAAPAAAEVIDPDETQAMPWTPRIGRGAPAEKDPTRPVGRLLGRAFGDQGEPE